MEFFAEGLILFGISFFCGSQGLVIPLKKNVKYLSVIEVKWDK